MLESGSLNAFQAGLEFWDYRHTCLTLPPSYSSFSRFTWTHDCFAISQLIFYWVCVMRVHTCIGGQRTILVVSSLLPLPVWGIKLKSLGLYGKYFICWAIWLWSVHLQAFSISNSPHRRTHSFVLAVGGSLALLFPKCLSLAACIYVAFEHVPLSCVAWRLVFGTRDPFRLRASLEPKYFLGVWLW